MPNSPHKGGYELVGLLCVLFASFLFHVYVWVKLVPLVDLIEVNVFWRCLVFLLGDTGNRSADCDGCNPDRIALVEKRQDTEEHSEREQEVGMEKH